MTLYTIGHSNHASEALIALLQQHNIALLADVRSQPHSRYSVQFNRAALQHTLAQHDIAYQHLGAQLGGRPISREFYLSNGKVDYAKLAESPVYLAGIERLLALAEEQRTAFMCAEADYHHCHRYWLITRTLVERGFAVEHILPSGEIVSAQPLDYRQNQLDLFNQSER